MKKCSRRSAVPVYYNCKSNNLPEFSHSALDGSKCSILKKRLTNKVLMTNYG